MKKWAVTNSRVAAKIEKISSGRGSAHNGRGTPIARKTKLGIDINIIFKFHPNRITSHEVVLWTDRQTDTDTQT